MESAPENIDLDIKFKTETLEEAQVSWTQTFTETDGLRVVWTEGGLRARPSYSPVLHPIAKTYKITGLEKNKGYKITIERGSLISSTTDKDALKEHANYQWTIVGHRNLLAGLDIDYDEDFAKEATVKWVPIELVPQLRVRWFVPSIIFAHGENHDSEDLPGAATEHKITGLDTQTTIVVQLLAGKADKPSDAEETKEASEVTWKVIAEKRFATVKVNLEKELERLRASDHFENVKRLEQKITGLEWEVTKARQELAEAKAEDQVARLQAQVEELEQDLKAKEEAYATLKSSKESADEDANCLRTENEELKQKESELRAKEEVLQQTVKELEEAKSTNEQKIESLEKASQELEATKSELEAAQAKYAQSQSDLAAVQQENADIRDFHVEQNRELKARQAKITELEETVKAREARIEELEKATSDVAQPDAKTIEELETAKAEVSQLEARVRELREELEREHERFKSKEEEMNELKEELGFERDLGQDAKAEVAQLKQEVERLTSEISAMNENGCDSCTSLRDQVETLRSEVSEAKSELETAKLLATRTQDALETSNQEKDGLMQEIEQLRQAAQDSESQKQMVTNLSAEVDQLKAELQARTTKVADLQNMCAAAEAQKAVLRENVENLQQQVNRLAAANKTLQGQHDERMAKEMAKSYDDGIAAGKASTETELGKLRKEIKRLRALNDKYYKEIYEKIGAVGAVVARVANRHRLTAAVNQFKEGLGAHVKKLLELSGENVDLVADVVSQGGDLQKQVDVLTERLGR